MLENAIPEELGFSSSRLSRVSTLLQTYAEAGKLAGVSALVARSGRLAYLESFGHASIEQQLPMRMDTIVRIFSLTKPVTVAAALLLYERGNFGLHDPVGDYLPAFGEMTVIRDDGSVVPASRPVTIHHLMTHTSGIATPQAAEGTAAEPAYKELWDHIQNDDVTTTEAAEMAAAVPLLSQPGERWRYGISTTVLGALIEAVSGKRFSTFLQEELFAPLKMVDTGFFVPPDTQERLAELYSPKDLTRTDLTNNLEFARDLERNACLKPPSLEQGGGGLVSTITDFAQFAQMLVSGGCLGNQQILGRKTVSLMASDHLNADNRRGFDWDVNRGYTFGLGVRVMADLSKAGRAGSVGEFGWAGSSGTWAWIDPKERMVALLMYQLQPMRHYLVERQFISMVYAALQ